MGSPTIRSLKLLRDRGYKAAVVEKWNSFAKIRIDLFGIFDLVGVKADQNGVIGIQCTTYSNLSARRNKIHESDIILDWLNAGNKCEIHGWRKVGQKGKRKIWEAKIEEVKKEDLPNEKNISTIGGNVSVTDFSGANCESE